MSTAEWIRPDVVEQLRHSVIVILYNDETVARTLL